MHTRYCKPISLCSSLLTEKRKKRGSTSELVVEPTAMPSLSKHLQNARAEDTGSRRLDDAADKDGQTRANENRGASRRPILYARQSAYRQFLKATALGGSTIFTDHESLPTLEAAYAVFKETYPRYLETVAIDELRSEEYGHLQETGRVCLDYCGFGLFSQLQQMQHWDSASFALADISVNLCSHALFGAAEEGSVEFDIRKRIMEYLNIQDTEYSMVFTASRGATFKLLADVYPFETCRQLITMYDYESESVGWMVQQAKEKGAKITSACFKWPSLRICSTDLKKQLLARKRRKDTVKGLFAFPVQSRVSGAKYSYQWMSLAQQNKWHILLDASALGPKDMDSLGLSLFRPDFIIASFYKVFGADPSGFGCLFIKNTTTQFIHDSSGAPASGIVRIIPFPSEWLLSESSDGLSEEADQFQDLEGDGLTGRGMTANPLTSITSSFSGPILSCNRQLISDVDRTQLPCFEGSGEAIEVENSSACEENENVSVGEVTRSPVFSDDGTDNLFCIDIGQSPLATVSRSSMSEEPFSGPICNHEYDGESFTHVVDVNQSPLCDAREEPTLLQEGEVGKEMAFCSPGDVRFNITADEGQSSAEDGESLEVTGLFASSRNKNSRGGEVELLDPGNSPLMAVNGRAEVQFKRKGPECAFRKVDQERAQFYIFESPLGNMEVGESSGEVQERDSEKNVKLADISNGKRNGVRDMEKTSGRNLETISEMDIDPDPCPVYVQSRVAPPPPDEQRGKEKPSPIPWNQKENAIRRETEGDFRLLGRRNGDSFLLGNRLPVGLKESDRLGFTVEMRSDDRPMDTYSFQGGEGSSSLFHGDDEAFSDDEIVEELWIEREPEVFCKCLDHADTLGLNKTNFRLRYLINWLINSLLQLRHPGPENNLSLVHIYGPQVRFDRGASVAFNLFDCHGKLLHPELVQMLADRSNISLGIGFLRNIRFSDNHMNALVDIKRNSSNTWKFVNGERDNGRMPSRIEVVTAALGILSNFEDVYRLWIFLARFLDADFVLKEVGRH